VPASLSAVDAIAPAFARMRAQLFQPFRMSIWARLAVVALTTGELSGNWSGGTNFSLPPQWGGGGKEGWRSALSVAVPSTSDAVLEYLPWIVLGVALLFLLGVLWLYCSCVFRVVLFEAVLHARCEIRAGWRRWQSAGLSYFLWTLAFLAVSLGALAMLVGVPVFLAWRAGLFKNTGQNFGILLAGGVLLFFVFLGLLLMSYAIDLLARDFVIPVMALENVGVIDGWRRFLPMLRAEKGNFVIYVLMKIVLAVGSEILFAIVNFFVLLICLIPLGIVGVSGYLIFTSLGLSWNITTILLAVAAGLLALAGILYLLALVYSPGLVFFQSYAIHFFGARYPRLGALLNPPSPPLPPPAAPPLEPAPSPVS